MTPGLAKSLAGLVVSIMTFLGWNTSEYAYLLPPQLQQQITVEENPKSETRNPKQETELNTEKKEDEKVVEAKPALKEKTPAVTKKPVAKTPIKKSTPKTSVTVVENKPISTPEPKPQPVYYPASIETITNEIKNIVNQIDPKKTETEIKKGTQNLSVEEKIKKSVVNIYCSRVLGNRIQKVTGSGVMIDEGGIVITNAHVAEYFLLAQTSSDTSCYIRTGSPAVSSYKAKLIYLPSQWISANENNLNSATLTGTGENDYALLAITERVRGDAPNIPLSFLSPTQDAVNVDQDIFVAGYPAGFSDVKILDSALYELTKPTTVTRVSGFDGRSVDVINTGGTSVAEHGSSGGAVVDSSGNLVALIVATNIDARSGDKNIQAITIPYIRRSIKMNSGKTFDSYISNARDEAESFEKTSLPILANTLLGN